MVDHRKALADIEHIRSQMAAATTFRGLGPAALAATAGLALLTATAQTALLPFPTREPLVFFLGWIATAVASAMLLGFEMAARTRRDHSGLADAMLHNAVQQFLPVGAAGAALAAILGRFAPETVWLLPGLWQVLVGLGLFATVRSLPRGTLLAAAWYFLAGCAVAMLGARDQSLSPWTMAVPFAVGQSILALVVHLHVEDVDGG